MTAFYTYVPVPRHVIERFGDQWTRPGKIVSNGCWTLDSWRQQDRFVFVKNPRYWDAGAVKLDRIEAYSVEDLNTATNLYKAGVMDWTTSGYIPSPFLPFMFQYADFQHARFQGVYFYSINVTRKPFDNVWVRRALNLVDRPRRDRARPAEGHARSVGQLHARRLSRLSRAAADRIRTREGARVSGTRRISGRARLPEDLDPVQHQRGPPPHRRGAAGDVETRTQHPGRALEPGVGFVHAGHRTEAIRRCAALVDRRLPRSHHVPRRLVTGDGNNRTGWSNARYDALLREAADEVDPARRLALLSEAEALLLDESPVIPIYHYTTNSSWSSRTCAASTRPRSTPTRLKHVWIDHDWKPGAPTLARAPVA